MYTTLTFQWHVFYSLHFSDAGIEMYHSRESTHSVDPLSPCAVK